MSAAHDRMRSNDILTPSYQESRQQAMPRRQRRPSLGEDLSHLDGPAIDAEIVAARARLSELLQLKDARSAQPDRQGGAHASDRADPGQQRDPRAIELYQWQRDAISAWQGQGQRGVVQAVTGAGKTRVGVAAIAEALAAEVRAVVLVPTLVLQRQWALTLAELLPGVVVATRTDDSGPWQVMVATVQSAMQRAVLTRAQPGLLVADECHRYGAESFARALGEEYLWRLGLTATLERGDQGDTILEQYFGSVCFDLGYEQALREELISPYRFALVSVPLSGDERSRYDDLNGALRDARSALVLRHAVPEEPVAEFLASVSRLAVDRSAAGSGLARLYMAKFSARKALLAETRMKQLALAGLSAAVKRSNGTIVFTQTQAASRDVAETLVATGCSAVAIHSDLDGEEREERLELFRTRATTAISAPRILDEGVDVPDCDLGIVMASNRSRRQMVQRLGRVLRRRPGKLARFVVLYAENTVEDPFAAECLPDFCDHCLPWAEQEGRFDLGRDQLPELLRFLGVLDESAGSAEQRQITHAATPVPSPASLSKSESQRSTSSTSNAQQRHEPAAEWDEAGERPGLLDAWPGASADPVRDYIRVIGRTPLLNSASEVRLSRQVECGLYAEQLVRAGHHEFPTHTLEQLVKEGGHAFGTLVCSNLRLVVSIAKRYTGRGMEFLDLIQEGNLGLIHAVELFDYRQGYKFSTYATWWIKQALTRAMANQARTIRLPVHLVEKLRHVHRQLTASGLNWDQFSRLHPEGLPDQEVAASDLAYGAALWNPLVSIDGLMEAFDDSIEMTRILGAMPSLEDSALDAIACDRLLLSIEDVLNLYDRRLVLLVACRYGFQTGEPETLEVIGARLGVTRERVRQMEVRALELLRAAAEGGVLSAKPAQLKDQANAALKPKLRRPPAPIAPLRQERAHGPIAAPRQERAPAARPPKPTQHIAGAARSRGQRFGLHLGGAHAVFDPAIPERARLVFASVLPDGHQGSGPKSNGDRIRAELTAAGLTLRLGEKVVLAKSHNFESWRDATDVVMLMDGEPVDAWCDETGRTLSELKMCSEAVDSSNAGKAPEVAWSVTPRHLSC